ncbi:alpha-N-acetylglucosaminidase, partial [Acrasis kona]
QDQLNTVRGLIHRLLPEHEHSFTLSIISSETDVFEIEYQASPTPIIALRGNSGVSLSSALHHYLKHYCGCQISWEARQLNISTPLHKISKIRLKTPHQYRYYLNTCTHGYSAVWWDWDRWEFEIDWMALHGINIPLMFTGQEKIWNELYQEMNVPTVDYFTGAAFLPWNRMGNLNGWGGPLSQQWMDKQFQLAKLILKRQREFGMKPILPGFNGYVPPQLTKRYPDSEVNKLKEWNGFEGTFYLNPLDPLFYKISSLFTKKLIAEFGTDHLYNIDPFNEETPPSNQTSYLSSVSKALFQPVVDQDPEAIWIMQGWFLYNEREHSFWQPEQTKALLNAVPQDRLVILDLWSEEHPLYSTTMNFYNHSFIWNMLHNFGQRPGMFGYLDNTANGPFDAIEAAGPLMKGIGLTMEGIHQNPVMYDFVTDLIWRTERVDVDEWVQQYAKRRYGYSNDPIKNAWSTLRKTVYNYKTPQFGPSLLIIGWRPALKNWDAPQYSFLDLKYIWHCLLLAHKDFRNNLGYRYDLVDVTSQILNDYARLEHAEMIRAYNEKNSQKLELSITSMQNIIEDLEEILASNENHLLGKWIKDAKKWGHDDAEVALMERNARLQVTSWGDAGCELSQYAYKMWAGLVGDFYKSRWLIFFDELRSSLQEKKEFDLKRYERKSISWDDEWVKSKTIYDSKPKGDTIDIANRIFKRVNKV